LRPLDLGTAGAVSLAGHACFAFAIVALIQLARLFDHAEPAAKPPRTQIESPADLIEVELPEIYEHSPLLAHEEAVTAAMTVPLGGDRTARADQQRSGRGGDGKVSEQALNFADQDDGLTRDQSPMSALTASQLPRIAAGALRRSFENIRSSRDPMELTFVAMGVRGVARERRKEAPIDPAAGLLSSQQRSELGAALGAAERAPGQGLAVLQSGSDRVGSMRRSLGVGVTGGGPMGAESAALRNARARPSVTQGAPSIPSVEEGRPSDTVESEQAVASRMQSIIHASTLGGAPGKGRGGEGGGGNPGAGGDKGAGQQAKKLGAGGSGPGDVERLGYIRGVQSKVHPLWANAFPRQAILEGRGGTAIVSFTIDANGGVSGVSISRKSGVPEFDENVRKAVLRGAPYGPLPPGLRPKLSLSLTFTAVNPAVRPKDPSNGPVD